MLRRQVANCRCQNTSSAEVVVCGMAPCPISIIFEAQWLRFHPRKWKVTCERNRSSAERCFRSGLFYDKLNGVATRRSLLGMYWRFGRTCCIIAQGKTLDVEIGSLQTAAPTADITSQWHLSKSVFLKPSWDRGPVNSFFIPFKFFLSSYIKLT